MLYDINNQFNCLIKVLLVSFLLANTHLSFANTPTPDIVIPKIDTKSKGHFLFDYHSGQVLATKNENLKIAPASLTKIMSLYVLFEAIKSNTIHLKDLVTISKNARYIEGSRMWLELNSQVSVNELLMGIIVQSGNDATIALAEHLDGNEETFVKRMNLFAKRLQLDNTNFVNSTGLPDSNHYSTPRDLGKLSQALIRDFGEFYDQFAIKEYTYNNITQPNRNQLLISTPYVDGIKTGHTESAGYCLVASGVKNGMRLISVVVGAKKESVRNYDSKSLLEYGFKYYRTHKIFSDNQPIDNINVFQGNKDVITVGINKPLYLTIPKGYFNKINIKANLQQRVVAPISLGKEVGKITVTLNGKTLAEKKLVSLEKVKQANLFSRFIDKIHLGVIVLSEKLSM